MSRHVASYPVALRRVVLRCERWPQHMYTATSLSHYANARRSHSHCSLSYHSHSHSLLSHHSHACARVVLYNSHRLPFRLPTHVFYLSFRCVLFLIGLSRKRSCATLSDLCWPLRKSREALALCLISNDGQGVSGGCCFAFAASLREAARPDSFFVHACRVSCCVLFA